MVTRVSDLGPEKLWAQLAPPIVETGSPALTRAGGKPRSTTRLVRRLSSLRCAASAACTVALLDACGGKTADTAPANEGGGTGLDASHAAGGDGVGGSLAAGGADGGAKSGAASGVAGSGATGGLGGASAGTPMLCTPGDSSRELVFIYLYGDGNEQLPGLGSTVMMENGRSYFLVDRGCRYWDYIGYRLKYRWGDVFSGVLSSDQAQALASDLRLGDWGDTNGWYEEKGGSVLIWWAGQVEPFQDEPRYTDTRWIQQVVGNLGQDLEISGSLWSGNVRYALADAQVDNLVQRASFVEGPTAVWPLSVAPEDVALSSHDRYPWKSRLATGDDATRLRDLRNQGLEGVIAVDTRDFIPIVQPDGTAYALYVRDSIPLEDDQGYLVLP